MNVAINIANRHALRGAKLLDEKSPGWAKRVHLRSIDMSDPFYCVLGQRYGTYSDGLLELNLESREEISHGFLVSFSERVLFGGWDKLQAAWIALIKERKAAA